jgi:hypothetical protein
MVDAASLQPEQCSSIEVQLSLGCVDLSVHAHLRAATLKQALKQFTQLGPATKECRLVKDVLCLVALSAGSRSLIAKSSSDGVLLEFWAHNRVVKVGRQGLNMLCLQDTARRM